MSSQLFFREFPEKSVYNERAVSRKAGVRERSLHHGAHGFPPRIPLLICRQTVRCADTAKGSDPHNRRFESCLIPCQGICLWKGKVVRPPGAQAPFRRKRVTALRTARGMTGNGHHSPHPSDRPARRAPRAALSGNGYRTAKDGADVGLSPVRSVRRRAQVPGRRRAGAVTQRDKPCVSTEIDTYRKETRP